MSSETLHLQFWKMRDIKKKKTVSCQEFCRELVVMAAASSKPEMTCFFFLLYFLSVKYIYIYISLYIYRCIYRYVCITTIGACGCAKYTRCKRRETRRQENKKKKRRWNPLKKKRKEKAIVKLGVNRGRHCASRETRKNKIIIVINRVSDEEKKKRLICTLK